jgi:hypothetical protein
MVTNYNVTIRHEKRKSLVMRMTTEGVLVIIPREFKPDHPFVKEFIAKGLKKMQGRTVVNSPTQQSSHYDLRAMVDEWAARIGVQPKRLQIREMYRKWGSCSTAGSVMLNQALCFIPPHLAEYVVCHELAHMREFNHGKGFRDLMNELMPDWQKHDKELEQYVIPRPA